jgi:hypothetical protein
LGKYFRLSIGENNARRLSIDLPSNDKEIEQKNRLIYLSKLICYTPPPVLQILACEKERRVVFNIHIQWYEASTSYSMKSTNELQH